MSELGFYLLLGLLATLCVTLGVVLWRRRGVPATAPRSVAGPRLRTAYRALMSEPSDREPLCALFSHRREGSWTDRAFAVDQLGEQPDDEAKSSAFGAALERWVEKEPDEALGQLLYGAWLLRRAWPASSTEDGDAELLARAAKALSRAAELDPADPTPHALAIDVATARGDEEVQARAHFAEVRRREPEHLAGHVALLRYLGPGWRGSREEMLRFVHGAVSKVSVGSTINALLAYAHLEAWRALRCSKDSRGARAYLDDWSNRAEVQASFARFCVRPQEGPDTIDAGNHWACWFYLTRDRANLQPLVTLLLQTPTRRPWSWLGAPERAVERALRYALRG